MAYRNGTYVAFHANGTTDPMESDIKYYNLIKAWTAKTDDDFAIINSHDKTSSVRDTSKRETLRASLVTRLTNSKHLLLIIGKTTKEDTDWVPFEIEYAIDKCKIPVIVAYTTVNTPILTSGDIPTAYWPKALELRIANKSVNAIHIPFKKEPIKDAVEQFSPTKLPVNGSLTFYGQSAYRSFGLL